MIINTLAIHQNIVGGGQFNFAAIDTQAIINAWPVCYRNYAVPLSLDAGPIDYAQIRALFYCALIDATAILMEIQHSTDNLTFVRHPASQSGGYGPSRITLTLDASTTNRFVRLVALSVTGGTVGANIGGVLITELPPI